MSCVDAVKEDIKKRQSVHMGLTDGKLKDCLPGKEHKRRVIDKLMANENVLLFLYDKMFPCSEASTTDASEKTGSPHKLKKAEAAYKVGKIPEMPTIAKNIDKAVKIKPQKRERPATATAATEMRQELRNAMIFVNK